MFLSDNDYFIGATDFSRLGKWVWAASRDPVVFTDWLPNEPTTKNGGYYEQCGEITKDGWNDYLCSNELNFICEQRYFHVYTKV